MEGLSLEETINIIKYSEIEDILIFNEKYAEILAHTEDMKEKRKFRLLKTCVQRRISEL